MFNVLLAIFPIKKYAKIVEIQDLELFSKKRFWVIITGYLK